LALLAFWIPGISAAAQPPDPDTSIQNLRTGILIVRMPSSRNKIDTLEALIARAKDDNQRSRLQQIRDEAIEDRNTLLTDYRLAFRDHYHFSEVVYYFDYDAHDLGSALYFNLEGEKIDLQTFHDKPLFYLHFERTEDSKIDALVIYDADLKRIPSPFPNNFSRGGFNFLFLKISAKNFPAWRVERIHKRLVKYYNEVRMSTELN
jgi:hypothetical protein